MRSWNWSRTATVTVVAALIATPLLIWHVVDPWHALAGIVLAGTLSILSGATRTTTADPEWPHQSVTARAGGRPDLSELGWSVFGRDGRVTQRVVRRIRAIAADRIRAHGIDPEDPAAHADIERLLGATVLDQLRSNRPPTARTVQTWLDAIERLGPPPAQLTEENRA